MAACVVMAMAVVFSIQQGEHGPLVVYKLQLPAQHAALPPAPVVIPAPPPAPSLEDVIVIPSRAPAILGTIVLPRSEPPPAAAPVFPAGEGVITLQQVSDEILWRRETAERLPQSPFSPRF